MQSQSHLGTLRHLFRLICGPKNEQFMFKASQSERAQQLNKTVRKSVLKLEGSTPGIPALLRALPQSHPPSRNCKELCGPCVAGASHVVRWHASMEADPPLPSCRPGTSELDVPKMGLSLAWTVQGCIEAAGSQAYIPQAPAPRHYNMSFAYSIQHG